MEKVKTNLAYVGDQGQPVLSTTYKFTGTEPEVVDLREEIVAEGFDKTEAAVHAVSVLPCPDAEFVEWLSGGTLTLDENGSLTGDPAVLLWLDAVKTKGGAW